MASANAAIQQLQDENMALRDTLQQMSSLGLPVELASDRGFQVQVLTPLHQTTSLLTLTQSSTQCGNHACCCRLGYISCKLQAMMALCMLYRMGLAAAGFVIKMVPAPRQLDSLSQTDCQLLRPTQLAALMRHLRGSMTHTLTHMGSLAFIERCCQTRCCLSQPAHF